MTFLLGPLLFGLFLAALAIGVCVKLLLAAARAVDWDRRAPVLLGVCDRMARRLDVPARGVRILTTAATLFTGIVPGLVAYVVAAVVLGPRTSRAVQARPKPQLLGLCADLAGRLDVPVDNVRAVALIVTLGTGIVPGMLLYFLGGIFKAVVLPGSRLEAWITRELPAWPRPAAGEARATAEGIPERIGRYRILGLLGRGGMGSVWRGRDDALGRDAAVKVVDGPFGSEAVRRFGEEARAAAALASPHIVQVWEYAPEARPPFLAMEYVPGRSVAHLIRAAGPQPIDTVLDCARQVLAGLATAHAAGIIHRDIKPANILLALGGPAAGTYKLTDFGLATSRDRGHAFTATGTLLGTLSYLAPEVALGDDATPSSDLYALGATLHEMLVGRPPISAETPLKLLRRITTEKVPPVAALRPDLPADAAAWLERLLARDPADRFTSAEQALAALGSVAGAAEATTDVGGAATTRGDDAIPWHLRPAPGSSSPRRQITDTELPDLLGRAMAFEAEGRDSLGEDSIIDIARELNVDPAAVREALLQSRRSGGEGVTQVFRRALGGEERGPWAPDRSRSDIFAKAWIPGRSGSDWTWRSTVVTACFAAFIAGLVGMTIIRVAREGAARTELSKAKAEAEARRVAEEILESTPPVPAAHGSLAEGEVLLVPMLPQPAVPPPPARADSPPSSASGTTAMRPAVQAAPGNRSPSAALPISLTEWAVISLVGAAVAALSGLRRRRARRFR